MAVVRQRRTHHSAFVEAMSHGITLKNKQTMTPKVIMRNDGYVVKARIVLEDCRDRKLFTVNDILHQHHCSSAFGTALRASELVQKVRGKKVRWVGGDVVTDAMALGIVNHARHYNNTHLIERDNKHRKQPTPPPVIVRPKAQRRTMSILWGLFKFDLK